MSGSPLERFITIWRKKIDHRLRSFFPTRGNGAVLRRAMIYGCFSGGKRIRPLLLLLTLEAIGCSPLRGLDAACALELVHSYSLIHDDLPMMDDDDFRRGLPTVHKKFGETAALLAGDGLLTHAFERVGAGSLDPANNLTLVRLLANAAGPEGMVLGQWEDFLGQGKSLAPARLARIQRLKTGRLMEVAVEMAAVIAGCRAPLRKSLAKFGGNLGQLFQLTDDLLDSESDRREGRPTAMANSSEAAVRRKIARLATQGAKWVTGWGLPGGHLLISLIQKIARRDQ